MGFHHVAQAGLERLTSGDLAASVSQSAGITVVNLCAQPLVHFLRPAGWHLPGPPLVLPRSTFDLLTFPTPSAS